MSGPEIPEQSWRAEWREAPTELDGPACGRPERSTQPDRSRQAEDPPVLAAGRERGKQERGRKQIERMTRQRQSQGDKGHMRAQHEGVEG